MVEATFSVPLGGLHVFNSQFKTAVPLLMMLNAVGSAIISLDIFW